MLTIYFCDYDDNESHLFLFHIQVDSRQDIYIYIFHLPVTVVDDIYSKRIGDYYAFRSPLTALFFRSSLACALLALSSLVLICSSRLVLIPFLDFNSCALA